MKKIVSMMLAAVMAVSLMSGFTASAAVAEIPVYKMTSKFSDVDEAVAAGVYKGVTDAMTKPAGSNVNCERYYQFTLTEPSTIFMEFLRGASGAPNNCNQKAVFTIASAPGSSAPVQTITINEDGAQAWGKTMCAAFNAGTYYVKVQSDYTDVQHEVNYNYAVLIGAMSSDIPLFTAQVVSQTDAYTEVKVNPNADCAGIWVRPGQSPANLVANQYQWTDQYKINSDTFRVTNNFGVYTVRVMDKYNLCYQLYIDLSRNVLMKKIKLSSSSKTIATGDQFSIFATADPYNATDRRVIWTSSDPGVAAISANGTSGIKVVGKKPGTATITCTAQDGSGVKSVCKVTVKPKRVTGIKLSKSGKKAMRVKWTKQKNITGYQMKFSTSKSYKKKSTKTYTVKAKTASKVVKNLKKRKKYYVKVRAYKTVGKKKLYGDYSYSYYGMLV